MHLEWRPSERYLVLPLQHGVEPATFSLLCNGQPELRRSLPLARTHADAWYWLDRAFLGRVAVSIVFEHTFAQSAHPYFSNRRDRLDKTLPELPSGSPLGAVLRQKGGTYHLNLYCALFGHAENRLDCISLSSQDLLYWSTDRVRFNVRPPRQINSAPFCQGNALCVPYCTSGIETHAIALMASESSPMLWQLALSFPFAQTNRACAPLGDKMRVFERVWPGVQEKKIHRVQTRFRVAPGTWPDIRLLPPDGNSEDIYANAYELKTRIDLRETKLMAVRFFGHRFTIGGGVLRYGSCSVKLATDGGFTLFHCRAGKTWLEVYGAEGVLCVETSAAKGKRHTGVSPVSENISHCDMDISYDRSLVLDGKGDSFSTEPLYVYGLRLPQWSMEAGQLLDTVSARGSGFYRSEHFTVYAGCVEDKRYGAPMALVTREGGVLSPVRVCEEFAWRPTGFGDMVRAVNRNDVWLPPPTLRRYPRLSTPLRTLQAAYNIALDTFALCTDKRFSLPGQQGLWASGLFQGPGEGFGVWVRDSAHIALRCGNLIDPETSRKTLLYTSHQGFDNASDGPAMAVVGLWDYFLATGDRSVLMEAWPHLLNCAHQIEGRYDKAAGLVFAPMSTSNDAFDEPENAGYPLSSETYYMLAFESLAHIGRTIGHHPEDCLRWESCGQRLRDNIRSLYWNEGKGFFTSGPKHSEAYQKGYWETSGEESVLWNRFGIATTEQKRSILTALEDAAMCEYGIVLFPYRKKENHFTGAVWPVWQAGFAQAAAETGDTALLKRLLAQQIRSAVINKTFYEVTDAETGLAWRWPGQLWHAAGFVSLLYFGVLGISYDQHGMRFTPAVPEGLTPLRVNNLRYRDAILDIELQGSGSVFGLLLDGKPVPCVPPHCRGRHQVRLVPGLHCKEG